KFFQDYYLSPDEQISNIYQFPFDEVPNYPDSVVAARIAELDRNTPFDLVYNQHVKDFIDLYAVRKRALTSRTLGLAAIYFPMFEEMLDKYNMPLELKYLAVVESALNPTAVSRAGARGLWQFMYNTGKMYGLKSTSLVDDRSDPYKATDAACRHLRDLYDIYGDWSLALAAYNSGAGNVNKAIRRSGGVKNYWAVWPYLPRETRGYVPAFIAVTYVMNYATEHNLYPLNPGILFGGIDTILVKDALSFNQISEFLNIPLDQVKFLNPAYKEGIIPATPDKNYVVRLPKDKVPDFINNEKALYQFMTKQGLEREKMLATIKSATERTVHIVKKGETLGKIANKYHCKVNDIKKWNGLKKNYLKRGQRIVIYPAETTEKKQVVTKTDTSPKTPQTKSDTSIAVADKDQIKPDTNAHIKFTEEKIKSEDILHVVKKGENLGLIARNQNMTVKELMAINNLKKSTLRIGQRLVIKAAAKPLQKENQKFEYYTVKSGDTLFKIAQSIAKMTVDELKKINSITSDNALKAGQKIIVAIIQ
ncbi:MAG: lytic transglycosylase, partial [Bacteroidetes bacterium HGW-Bacteroidetes-22]